MQRRTYQIHLHWSPKGLGHCPSPGTLGSFMCPSLDSQEASKTLVESFLPKPLRKILLHTYSVPCGSVFLSQVTELDVQGEMMCEVGEWTCSGSLECMGPESHGAAFPWRMHHGSQLSPALSPRPSFYPREVVTVLSILS